MPPLKVYRLERVHGLAHVALVVSYGSCHDPLGAEGLAHLIEHVIVRTCFSLVDELSASTGRDRTVYRMTVRVEELHVAIDRMMMIFDLAERMVCSTVSDEIDVVCSEISERQSDQAWRLRENVLSELWHGTSYEHSPLGTRGSIATVDADVFMAEYLRYYKPGNSILVVGIPSGVSWRGATGGRWSASFKEIMTAEQEVPDVGFAAPLTFTAGLDGRELSCFAWTDHIPHVILRGPLEARAGVRLIHVPLRGGWLVVGCCEAAFAVTERLREGLDELNSTFRKDLFVSDSGVNRRLLLELRLDGSASDVVARRPLSRWLTNHPRQARTTIIVMTGIM